MEISPRKPSKRAQEPVDEWLQSEGYFRKHAPRDPTCLFRAVSEQVYLTQHYHIKVRKECVEFMRQMKHLFAEHTIIPFENYLEQMACFTEWGGANEIQAMSLLYKREFVIFNGQKETQRAVTNNGFKDTIYLCHTPQRQYESIYTRDYVATAAYCQSIVYQTLYKDVFHMASIESTVHKMLHDRNATFRHDKFFLKGNLEIREQLTAEIYNKLEGENDETDDASAAMKGVPPFPYRVAKALDPNIYRNTDFDIWHEIRREVKNAGWTRHNSHELQVGGKCLVQMDFEKEEYDKANNNSIYVSSLEKISCNSDGKALQRKSKEPIFFYGHVQEMSKNQGPVVVFIEELGEKKTVAYSALKPLPLRKNKQNNWLPIGKRNVVLESNQNWKKPCATNPRKLRESISTMNILSTSIDKNANNNGIHDNNKSTFQGNQWKEESLNLNRETFENYTAEKCSNYLVNNSDEIFTNEAILDGNELSNTENIREDPNKETEGNSLSFPNNNSENSLINKATKCRSTMNTENDAEFNVHPKQRPPKESYCQSYPGMSGDQMDRMLRSINCSVQKSVDLNGNDLPLSDPFTLRFFYNLGLEYFRVSNTLSYTTNGQSVNFGQWCQGTPQTEDDVNEMKNGIVENSTVTQQKEDNYNAQKDMTPPLLPQEPNKCDGKDAQAQKAEISKGEIGKDYSRERPKDQINGNKDSQRMNRSGLAPRFKKNPDTRQRNNVQQYPQQQQYAQNFNQYQQNSPNSKNQKSHESKNDITHSQHLNSTPHQVHTMASAPNSYHAPYMQQNVYPSMPYYASEAETYGSPYYTPNPGYYPIPCLPHSDIPDNSNMQPFSPHMCPGMDYAQAYSGMCSPYMCPQPTPYNIPSQNMQEHWYAVAGQPHYMQYAQILPVAPETACNGIAQNSSQPTSS